MMEGNFSLPRYCYLDHVELFLYALVAICNCLLGSFALDFSWIAPVGSLLRFQICSQKCVSNEILVCLPVAIQIKGDI